jgi:hypothetical protein
MANKENNSGKYWPYFILGFIFIGLFLGFWTIRSAISMPVSESNEFQKKYQDADMNINDILEAEQRFGSRYHLEPLGFKPSTFKPKDYAMKHGKVVQVSKVNVFKYRVTDTQGKAINDANVTLLVTRPQTVKDDQTFPGLKADKGIYTSPRVTLPNAGRYLLRLRVQIGDAVAYLQQEAYLKP